MRVWFGFAAALLATFASGFEGVVLGPDGEPLAGARVSELGRAGVVVADSRGYFRLEPDPMPPFFLVVTRPDGVAFRPVLCERLPNPGEVLTVRLETLSEAVTVLSGGVPDLHLPPAAAGTVLGKGDLARRQPSTVTDALENVPGVGRGEEGYSTVPGLRGLPKHRTLILLDDGRVTAERRAGPSATFLVPETVDEIEVVRGPGSVAYGSDALGGVIRARSRMPSPGQGVEARYALFGAWGLAGKGAMAEVSGSLGKGAMLLAAHVRDFGNYRGVRGEVPFSGAEHKGFRVAYQVPLAGGLLGVGWRSDLGRDIDKPEPQFASRHTYYPEENSHRANVFFERSGPGAWSRIGFSAAWNSYQLVLDRDVFATARTPRTLTRADVDAEDYTFRAEAERPLSNWGRLVVGVDASGRFNLRAVNTTFTFSECASCGPTASTPEVSIAKARRDDWAAFAGLSGRWGPLETAFGLRGDRVGSSNSGGYFGDRSITNSRASGFAAVTVHLAPFTSLTAQLARGFRSPLLSDRFYRGISGRGFITGNPDLRPESSRQYDVAARWGAAPLAVALYGYLYRIDDFIERYRAGNDFFFRNRGEVEIRGFELEASVALGGDHTLGVGAHSLLGEVRGTKSPVDDIPSRGIFAVYRHEPTAGWHWMLRAAAYARDERPGPTEQLYPGYGVVDASVGYRFSPQLEVSLLGRNLFDHDYLGSPDVAAMPAPGRNFQLVLRGKV